jgi:hypothetical protein
MSARMAATLRSAELNRQSFRYFRSFQHGQEIEAMPAAMAALRTADQCWTSPIRTLAAPRSRPSATDSCQPHVVRIER